MCMGGVAGRVRTHREIKEGLDVKVVRGKDEIEEGLVANLHKLSVPLLCTEGRQVGVEPASRACASRASCTPRGTCAPPHPPKWRSRRYRANTAHPPNTEWRQGVFHTHSHTRAAGRGTTAIRLIAHISLVLRDGRTLRAVMVLAVLDHLNGTGRGVAAQTLQGHEERASGMR